MRAGRQREVYIDAFRGLVALVMVQGHFTDALLLPEARAHPLYQFQVIFHGSTAPGFLFASGFVAGLPRAPLSLRASVRRARRLLFVLGLGYALHVPYLSCWKIANEATAAQRAALFACDALQVIAAAQLFVLLLQWLFARRWVGPAATCAGAVVAAGPGIWASGVAAQLPLPLGAYLDASRGSPFPLFPYAAFVLAGTVAGAAIGRQDPDVRRRRALVGSLSLLGAGTVLALLLRETVDFWGPSPGYTLLRLGGLLLVLRIVEGAAQEEGPLVRLLALLGHQTLLVYVLHLYLLYGWVLGPAPYQAWLGQLGYGGALGVLALTVPVLAAAAWSWHRVRQKAPHAATLVLVFLGTLFVWEFATSPW